MSLPFSKLAEMYSQLEATSSGNKMREILSKFFKAVPKEDIDRISYLTLGRIGPEFEEIDLGMAEKMVLKSIAMAFDKNENDVMKLFKKFGDVGFVAEELSRGKAAKKLTVSDVFENFWKIKNATGAGSQEAKIMILAGMLRNSSPLEARYLARIAQGTLRLGAGTMTILDSLSIAFTGTKANKPELEHAYNICSDVGAVAKAIATKGLSGIKKFDVIVGRPIKMMLAQRVKSISEIKEKMPGKIAAEEKYDGERMQIHKKGNDIIIYSRRLENITYQFPDVVENAKRFLKAKDCVVEGEAVATEGEKLLPFQVLMQRRRKYEIEKYVKKIPITLFLFDLLYLNGKSYIREPYPKRRVALERVLIEKPGIRLARQIVSDKIEDIEDFFNESLQRGGEGILAKSTAPDSVYQAGTRGWLWIKWKREYMKEIRETIDLVIVGAFMGRGMRSGTYGALLCAAYNPQKDRFETVCKVGSGFSEDVLFGLPKRLSKYKTAKPDSRLLIHGQMKPDVFFEPKVVIEVLGAEITKSPIHTCAIDKFKTNGLAVRFPRFIKFRLDKGPEDATTVDEIIQMYGKR